MWSYLILYLQLTCHPLRHYSILYCMLRKGRCCARHAGAERSSRAGCESRHWGLTAWVQILVPGWVSSKCLCFSFSICKMGMKGGCRTDELLWINTTCRAHMSTI